MRGFVFLVVGASMLVGSARGLSADFAGYCQVGPETLAYFGDFNRDLGITEVEECFWWCRSHLGDIQPSSTSPLRGVTFGGFGSAVECLCMVDGDTLTVLGEDQRFRDQSTAEVFGVPDGGSGQNGWNCYITPPPCDINVVVGIDQTSMKSGDDSLQAFTDKLFELTDELPIGPDDVWMEVAYLQGHKQKGKQHKKQITIALGNAESQADVVDPRDFVTETELIRRRRTPFLAFFKVLVPDFIAATNSARPSYCLIFTNKGDIERVKDKKALRTFAKQFRADPPCTPVCYQDSPQADGPSFLARVLCADEHSLYSDTYDAAALKTTMCAVTP